MAWRSLVDDVGALAFPQWGCFRLMFSRNTDRRARDMVPSYSAGRQPSSGAPGRPHEKGTRTQEPKPVFAGFITKILNTKMTNLLYVLGAAHVAMRCASVRHHAAFFGRFPVCVAFAWVTRVVR